MVLVRVTLHDLDIHCMVLDGVPSLGSEGITLNYSVGLS